jgi:hypothetical protein
LERAIGWRQMTGKIFLNYRRDDTAGFAHALFVLLKQSFPSERLFMDVGGGIGAGQDFVRVIEEQVRACDAMLVLIGPDWLKMPDVAGRRRVDDPLDFVHLEVESALRFGKRVIPVLVQKAKMPSDNDLPPPLKALARRNAVGLTNERFEADVQGLVKELKDALVEAEETRRRAAAAADEARRTAEQARSTEEAAQNPMSAKAQEMLNRLAAICGDKDLAEAKDLVGALRDEALYETMGALAEAVSRRDPNDARNRRLYAQYLVNTGKATAAIDMLTVLAQHLPKNDPEFAEAMGLIGHANKQIFVDAGDKADPSAHAALEHAVAAYRIPFEESPQRNTWHGVNLLALLHRARRLGLQITPDLTLERVAQSVIAELGAVPEERRDPVWYPSTLAEASLGLEDWDAVERNVRVYAASGQVRPFQIESTLRQFTLVWDVEALNERGRGVVTTLRARLLQLKGGEVKATPEEVTGWREQLPPTPRQLEEILGSQGPQTYKWWRTGLERSLSVCSVRQRLGQRFGTGFLVRAGDLGLQPPDELVVLTTFHVVNNEGALGALTPDAAEIAFEAADGAQIWPVKTILWSSPAARHDASVLRLQGAVAGVAPLRLAAALPTVETNAEVYIIGYTRGQDLAFSFQDNDLLDHEGPPGGTPQIPGVSRVHYRARTEPGSSGSPVFDAKLWEVIALHHKGSKDGLPRLNGKPGVYAANEGISILSIKGAIEHDEMHGH